MVTNSQASSIYVGAAQAKCCEVINQINLTTSTFRYIHTGGCVKSSKQLQLKQPFLRLLCKIKLLGALTPKFNIEVLNKSRAYAKFIQTKNELIVKYPDNYKFKCIDCKLFVMRAGRTLCHHNLTVGKQAQCKVLDCPV